MDSESSDSQREKIMGIVAGMISAGLSFGWVIIYIIMHDWNMHYDPATIKILIREFVGPIVGGGLTDLFNFRVTATVSEKFLIAAAVD